MSDPIPRRHRRIRTLTWLAALLAPAVSLAAEPVNQTRSGEAILGYDPVAYFEEERPEKGSPEWTAEWNGATWLFASERHRDLFVSEPERWAPQYGGYCAWAVSNNSTAGIDPEAWTLHRGKLYLNYSRRIQQRWLGQIEEAIARADRNWPGVLDE